jgi:acetylornithine/succinyldiaminopimelate/putrescine aminotransferase
LNHSDAPSFVRIPFGNIDAMINAIDDTVSAVLLETIPATLGFYYFSYYYSCKFIIYFICKNDTIKNINRNAYSIIKLLSTNT